jgi:TPR repeat protein
MAQSYRDAFNLVSRTQFDRSTSGLASTATVVSSVFYDAHKRNLAKESGSAAELTAASAQLKVKNADQRHIVHNPVRGVLHVIPAKLETAAQTPDPAKEDDPVELWKAVKRGNVSAEVALANFYLQGKSVPQSCEQAHMLLQTASAKGRKAADTLLKGSYAERCE